MRRPTLVRLSLAAAGLAVVGLVGSASAAAPVGPKTLALTDPAGDSTPGLSGDITGVTFTTTGVTKTVKKKKTYTPSSLVITMTTKDKIDTSGTTSYEVDTAVGGCGTLFLYWSGSAVTSDCAVTGAGPTDTAPDVPATVTAGANTVTFTLPFGAAAGPAAGGTVSAIDAYTGLVDPVFGFGPTLVSSSAGTDELSSAMTYTIG